MEKPISPGQLINLSIRRQYSKEYGTETEQLTKYIDEEIAIDGISSRKIARLRDTEDFPSMKTLKNLSEKVEDVSILDPETACERLLLEFRAIHREQKKLLKLGNLKITIVAGLSRPQALGNDNIATTLANNIHCGASYEFIYPSFLSFPESLYDKDISSLAKVKDHLTEDLKDLFLRIYQKLEKLDISDTGRITKTKKAINTTANKVKFISTHYDDDENSPEMDKLKNMANLFWMMMPSNYAVFYNLGEKDEFDNTKCGSFFVEGQSFRDDPNEPSFKSKGWLHMEQGKYQQINNQYLQLKGEGIWKEIGISQAIKDKELS
jgi:hypothetical protein